MIPVGYMYKKIAQSPDWLNVPAVKDIYSVSSCISNDFTDWINFWKHNGYWFFDSPEILKKLMEEENISPERSELFYYQVYEKQWNEESRQWIEFQPEPSFYTDVEEPENILLEGYDIVSFSCQTSAECSPLSCNHMAQQIPVNSHCLLSSLEQAVSIIESNQFEDCEPGPYRIFAVYRVIDLIFK